MFISIHPDDRECSAVMCLRIRTGWDRRRKTSFATIPCNATMHFLFAMIGGQNKQLWFCIFA